MPIKIKEEVIEEDTVVPNVQIPMKIKQEAVDLKTSDAEESPVVQRQPTHQHRNVSSFPQQYSHSVDPTTNWNFNQPAHGGSFDLSYDGSNVFYPLSSNNSSSSLLISLLQNDNQQYGKSKRRKQAKDIPRKIKTSPSSSQYVSPEKREEQRKYLEQVYSQEYSNFLYMNYLEQFGSPYQPYQWPAMTHPSWFSSQ